MAYLIADATATLLLGKDALGHEDTILVERVGHVGATATQFVDAASAGPTFVGEVEHFGKVGVGLGTANLVGIDEVVVVLRVDDGVDLPYALAGAGYIVVLPCLLQVGDALVVKATAQHSKGMTRIAGAVEGFGKAQHDLAKTIDAYHVAELEAVDVGMVVGGR